MNSIQQSLNDAYRITGEFLANENNILAIENAGKIMIESLSNHKKIIRCGNGGSMSDAMHFAEELTGRFRVHRPAIAAIAIADPTHITCAANDYGFDHIFSRFIEGLGQKDDVLLAISTSGNSANVINAINSAKEKQMKIIGLTGKNGGLMSKLCDIEIRAPYSQFSDRTQEIHIKIIHTLIEYIEGQLFTT
jgi:D-sedoheptulose 7-phosphate isomerase